MCDKHASFFGVARTYQCQYHGRFTSTVPVCPECGHGEYVTEVAPMEVPRRITPVREPVCAPRAAHLVTRRLSEPSRYFFLCGLWLGQVLFEQRSGIVFVPSIMRDEHSGQSFPVGRALMASLQFG